MVFDCIIIGGGPAGLNAALILGRANLNILILDDERPRNRVTEHSHGFITNDHLSPMAIRQKGYQDLNRYPNISKISSKVTEITSHDLFLVKTSKKQFKANRILIATGLNETLPSINGLKELYGNYFFNCPFCDGWEMQNKKLAIITGKEENILHLSAMISHWSKSVIVCTNGLEVADSIKLRLEKNNISLYTQTIKKVDSEGDKVNIILEDHPNILIDGEFTTPLLEVNLHFAKSLNIETNEVRKIVVDDFGKTSHKNVYAAGDTTSTFGEQLVFAASSGSKVAMGIVKEIALSNFI